MKRALLVAAVGAVLALAGPVAGQSRGNDTGWWPWAGGEWESASAARGQNQDRRIEDREVARGRGQKQKKGNGPPFCRNGAGHPVHGMAWCQEKGWTNGWDRAPWGDVLLRSPRRQSSRFDQPALGDILGRVVLGRLTGYRSSLGSRDPLTARIVDLGRRGSVLQVRAGGLPLAEFTDFNRDGRVDLVLLANGG